MRYLRYILCLVVTAGMSLNAVGDGLKDAGSARMLTDQVMVKVGKGDIAGGIGLTKKYLIIPAAEFDVMLEQLKMQEPVMALRYGKSVGHEFLREQKVGNNLLRIVHVHHFERHAMRWSFYFYRGPGGWVLNTFKSDDDIRQLFEE